MKDAHILIVDDNKNVLTALELLLKMEYRTVKTIRTPNELSGYDALKNVDIILLDMNFSAGVNTGNEGLYWLKEIRKRAPEISVIMMTAYGSIDLAVQALKQGATDFTLKPWNNEKLLTTIHSAWQIRKSRKEIDHLKRKESNLKQVISPERNIIVGKSNALRQVLKLTQKVARTDVNVLITGENGTGKELIARELHRMSPRNQEVFIGVDMGSISESLFESELFGHVKGAYTDAKTDRAGKFETADGGSLFLDEIGNLSLSMQAKLLSAIQNRSIVRVGSNAVIPVDIRLISATNSDLPKMVAEGHFREDLLYRLNTIQIKVPPLRDRVGDIGELTNFFLPMFAAKYGKPDLKVDPGVLPKLEGYSWPGNIRELRHTIERAVILCEENILRSQDFMLQTSGSDQNRELPDVSLEEMEEMMIRRTLDSNGGNYTAAAQQLGISRQTLYNKVEKMKNK